MPNHITTQVEITGTKEQIAKLIKDTKIVLDGDIDKNQFDFNGIVKMPKELLKTTSPTDVVPTEEEAKALNAEAKALSVKNNWGGYTDRTLSQAEADRRTKEYGALNWYDWSTVNWGTKWNAYDVKYLDHDDTKLVVQMDTAWGTPEKIWDILEQRGYTVKGVYYGEMDGYDFIGDGADVFEAYEEVQVEYVG